MLHSCSADWPSKVSLHPAVLHTHNSPPADARMGTRVLGLLERSKAPPGHPCALGHQYIYGLTPTRREHCLSISGDRRIMNGMWLSLWFMSSVIMDIKRKIGFSWTQTLWFTSCLKMMQEALGNSRQQGDDIIGLFIWTPSWKSLKVSSQVSYDNMLIWNSLNNQISLKICQNN